MKQVKRQRAQLELDQLRRLYGALSATIGPSYDSAITLLGRDRPNFSAVSGLVSSADRALRGMRIPDGLGFYRDRVAELSDAGLAIVDVLQSRPGAIERVKSGLQGAASSLTDAAKHVAQGDQRAEIGAVQSHITIAAQMLARAGPQELKDSLVILRQAQEEMHHLWLSLSATGVQGTNSVALARAEVNKAIVGVESLSRSRRRNKKKAIEAFRKARSEIDTFRRHVVAEQRRFQGEIGALERSDEPAPEAEPSRGLGP
jgi:flagellin-like hook-associated protein FlgL